MKYSERPAEDGCLLMPPSGGVAGRTKVSDREVTTGKNFKHPSALRDLRSLQLYIEGRGNKGMNKQRRRSGGGGEEGRGWRV